ncbi:MAG: hypothetical protein ABI684_15085, partial [Nitrospirota bacterium]
QCAVRLSGSNGASQWVVPGIAGAEYTALSVFASGRCNMKRRSRLHALILDRDSPTFLDIPRPSIAGHSLYF